MAQPQLNFNLSQDYRDVRCRALHLGVFVGYLESHTDQNNAAYRQVVEERPIVVGRFSTHHKVNGQTRLEHILRGTYAEYVLHFNNQLVLLPTHLRARKDPGTQLDNTRTRIDYTADLQQHQNHARFQDMLENFVASLLPPYGVPHTRTTAPHNLRSGDPTAYKTNPLTSVPKPGGAERVIQRVPRPPNSPSEYLKTSPSILASSLSMPTVLSDVLKETQIPILRISVKSILGRMNVANILTSDWGERAFGFSNAGPFLGRGPQQLDTRKDLLLQALTAVYAPPVAQNGLADTTIVYPNPRTRAGRHWLDNIFARVTSLINILEEQWPGPFPQNLRGEVRWPGNPPHVNAPMRYNRPIRSTWLLALQLTLTRIEFEVIPVLRIQVTPPRPPATPMTAGQRLAIRALLRQVLLMFRFLRREFPLPGRVVNRPNGRRFAPPRNSILGMPRLYPAVQMS